MVQIFADNRRMVSRLAIATVLVLATASAGQPPTKVGHERSFVGSFCVDLKKFGAEVQRGDALKTISSDASLKPEDRKALLVLVAVMLMKVKVEIKPDRTYTLSTPVAVTEGTWTVKNNRLIGTPRHRRPPVSGSFRTSDSVRLTPRPISLEWRANGLRLMYAKGPDSMPLRPVEPTAPRSK